jgi:putative transport protein
VIDTLTTNPVALALLAIGLGAIIGAIRVKGVALGAAGALFAGLGIGAINDDLGAAPGLAVIKTLGLVFFTYTVGLASGPSFVSSVRRGGAKALAVAAALVVVLAGMVTLVELAIGGGPPVRAGLFAGSTTNTPSLEAAIEALRGEGGGDPVVAYSLAYPFAVLMMILVQQIVLQNKAPLLPARTDDLGDRQPTVSWTVAITTDGLPPLGELRSFDGHPLAFSRYRRPQKAVKVATNDVVLAPGDLVTVVGPAGAVEAFSTAHGARSDEHLALDRSTIDFRRMAVSNRRVAGRRIGDLDLVGQFGAAVTRVRRGDADMPASDDLVLNLGDRVRVVGPTDRLADVAHLLGDSDQELSELDAIGFALGAAVGILIGLIPIPLPGGGELELGNGGGPLIAGIVLGTVARVGPVTFQIPHAANLVLRQFGVYAFLACAGLASGSLFAEKVLTLEGLELAVSGLLLALVFSTLVALSALWLLRQGAVATSGTVAGVNTQPAALQFATKRTLADERVGAAYALVFPVAMIVKIIVVQFLV